MLNALSNATAWLEGKKTYLICLVAIGSALLAYLDHQINGMQLAEAVFGALGGASIRHGITTTTNSVTEKVIDATQAAAVVMATGTGAGGLSNPANQPHDPNDLG